MIIPTQYSISSLSYKYRDTSHQYRIRLLKRVNNFVKKEFKNLKTLPKNELMTSLLKFEKYIDYRNCLSSCISVLSNTKNAYLGLPQTIQNYYKKYKSYTITGSWVCPSFYEINQPIKKIIFVNSSFIVYV